MTLAAFLENRHLSQEKFAERLGVSQSSVSKWVAGSPPKRTTMLAIERATDGAVPIAVWFRPASEDEAV